MMSVAPPFLVTYDQAQRLQGYLYTYRHYAFTSLLPSPERNMILRVLQGLRGKLIEAMEQAIPTPARLSLLLSKEERITLRSAVTELVSLYNRQAESAERIATLSDLAALEISLKNH